MEHVSFFSSFFFAPSPYKKMMIMMAMLTILVILLFTGSGVVDDNRARWRCQLWSCLLGVVAIYGGGGTMTSLIMS